MDHQEQLILPVSTARRLLFISAIFLYSLACDFVDVKGDNNFATALTTKIQISVAIIGTVRKPAREPISLAKQFG